MVTEVEKLHDLIDMFMVVILNAIVSMMLSEGPFRSKKLFRGERPFRRDLAFVSWMWTVFLGVMWVVGVLMYFL